MSKRPASPLTPCSVTDQLKRPRLEDGHAAPEHGDARKAARKACKDMLHQPTPQKLQQFTLDRWEKVPEATKDLEA